MVAKSTRLAPGFEPGIRRSGQAVHTIADKAVHPRRIYGKLHPPEATMKVASSTWVVLMLATSALAAGSKGTSKAPVQSADEMECDHPEAKPESASAKEPGAVIVRGAKIDKAPNI